MSQITTGVRSILSSPLIYSSFQNLMGARKCKSLFVQDYVRPKPGNRILDIGCGPADILDHLADVDYWGFDISSAYISKAKAKYGGKGRFFCKNLTHADIDHLPAFDVVMAIGVLHHLDDMACENLLRLVHRVLKPGGRLVTMDPCLEQGQNPIARFLIMHDRGQNVRTLAGYESLVAPEFSDHQIKIRHKTWIPYTHCLMECTRS